MTYIQEASKCAVLSELQPPRVGDPYLRATKGSPPVGRRECHLFLSSIFAQEYSSSPFGLNRGIPEANIRKPVIASVRALRISVFMRITYKTFVLSTAGFKLKYCSKKGDDTSAPLPLT